MEMKKFNVLVYELPPCDDDEDDHFKAKDKQMKATATFCDVSFLASMTFLLPFDDGR